MSAKMGIALPQMCRETGPEYPALSLEITRLSNGKASSRYIRGPIKPAGESPPLSISAPAAASAAP